jgi:DNA adenine methylase
LSATEIYNKSYIDIINENKDNEKAFFFLDPPYENKKKTDYKDYTEPKEVFKAVSGIKGKFLITYNKSDEILETFKEYNIREITTTYANTQFIDKRDKVELVITNY